MKKTLVALAVLAATGTSFAQVSITGKLGFSYQKNSVPAGGAANHGMQMADGDLNFSATEDLGGGMSITAKSAFVSRGRDTGITGRDASIALVTPAGVFGAGSVESASPILNTAGAPVSLSTGHDGAANVLIDAAANLDFVGYSLPIGPVTIGLLYADSIGAAGAGAGTTQANQVSAKYVAGAISATLDYTVFASSASAVTDGYARTRLFGSYDLGVAKLGAGVTLKNKDLASQYSVSVAVPLGAVDLGLVHSARNAQTASALNGNAGDIARSGTAVGMNYNLSKTATINASYGVYSDSATSSSEYRLRLMKSF